MLKKPIFKKLNSTDEVIQYAKSQLPITSSNMLITLINTYHNTLLEEMFHENQKNKRSIQTTEVWDSNDRESQKG